MPPFLAFPGFAVDPARSFLKNGLPRLRRRPGKTAFPGFAVDPGSPTMKWSRESA
jgi:hypothetical protein